MNRRYMLVLGGGGGPGTQEPPY